MLCIAVATLCATVTGNTQDRIEPDGAYDIATFESGGTAYAAVASTTADRVQASNVANRLIHWPVASINDGDTVSGKTYDELWGARYVATARIGSNTYALVTAYYDNGIQIIGLKGPLTVDAGQDRTVREGEKVTLSGTVSDPEDERLTYQWTHDSNLSIGLDDDTAPSTGFTAPAVTADTSVTFTLAVSDGIAAASDTVSVTIEAGPVPTLASLTLSGVDIGEFHPGTTAYVGAVAGTVTATTVTATPTDSEHEVTIADTQGRTVGTSRTVSLAKGSNQIAVTVVGAHDEATGTYTVTVTRVADTWGERLPEKDIALDAISRPTGIWGTAETLWIAAWGEYHLYAYDFEGGRVSGKDLTLASGGFPNAMWSDATTLWVADHFSGVQAHSLADGSRVPDEDFGDATATGSNDAPNGLWSDGETLWVADWDNGEALVYKLEDGSRIESRDFTLGLYAASALTSDGGALWVADWDGGVKAYRLSDGERLADRDLDAETMDKAGNAQPAGLWSDGETLWVVDELEQKAYAYAAPGLRKPAKRSNGLVSGLSSRAMAVPGGTAAGPPASIPDPGLRGRIAAALGKADTDTIGVHELGALVVLDARNAAVADLTGLEHAVNLEGLDLGHNAVADVRPLTSLTALRRLNLDGTAPDLWALAALDGLQELSLRSNGLDDIWALSSMNRLRVLDLADNGIEDLTAVGALRNLVILDVSENRVTDLSPLAGLQALSELKVRGNRINYLSPLPDRDGLRILGVGEQHRRD